MREGDLRTDPDTGVFETSLYPAVPPKLEPGFHAAISPLLLKATVLVACLVLLSWWVWTSSAVLMACTSPAILAACISPAVLVGLY